MSLALAAIVLGTSLMAPQEQAAAPAVEKLHPYLRQEIDQADSTQRIPVYFAMRERLRYADFGTRIRGLDKDSRREMVVGELRDHMLRTQEELMSTLQSFSDAEVVLISRNYLGNFVRVEATPDAVLALAAVDAVGEVWFDHAPALSEVEDSAPVMGPVVARGIGNGPRNTRAVEVWDTGVTGAGVVWMNSDSGVRASQANPTNIHPGLVGRLWENPGEIRNNGVDDDGNGKIDDYHGWGFDSNTKVIEDNGGHGTSTAGVFVAHNDATTTELGNCPDTKIMTGRLSGESSQWDSIQYAIDEGAHGQTSSHSYKNNFNPAPNYKMHRDVGETSMAAGLIRTNSTSNNGGSLCSTGGSIAVPFNISAPGCLPAPWIHPDQTLVGGLGGVLGIGAHNLGAVVTQPSYTPCGPFAWHLDDLLAVISYPLGNWSAAHNDYPWFGGSQMGLLKPDLTGPTGTTTSSGSSSFTTFSGTSNATPSVSSCLALALSANLSLTPEDMAMAVQTTAIDYGAPGKDNLSGAGKLDAWELTKMARNLHRVDGDVAHTVQVSVAAGTVSFELDSIPNRKVFLIYGTSPDNLVSNELTLRIQNPRLGASGMTDTQGNYSFTLPLQAGWAGLTGYSQFVISDPEFGPLTGSNAIRVQFVP